MPPVKKGILKRKPGLTGRLTMKKKPKASPKASSSKGPSLPKGGKVAAKAKAKGKLAKSLTSRNLGKIPKMTLQEKVQMAEADNETAETAAQQLKGTLTKDESAKMWSKHNTFLKHNPEEAADHSALSKKEKGQAVVVWYLKNCQKKRFHTQTQKRECRNLEKKVRSGSLSCRSFSSSLSMSSTSTWSLAESLGAMIP